MTKEDSRRASTADQSPFTTKNPVGIERRCAGGTQKRIVTKGKIRMVASAPPCFNGVRTENQTMPRCG